VWLAAGERGGDFYERLGMLVTSLRSINQGYCSHIVCSRRNVTILGVLVSFQGALDGMIIKNRLLYISVFALDFRR